MESSKRKPSVAEILPIREIRTKADVVRELDLLHNKHMTEAEYELFLDRFQSAIKPIAVDHEISTQISIFVNKKEYLVTLKRVGNMFALTSIPH